MRLKPKVISRAVLNDLVRELNIATGNPVHHTSPMPEGFSYTPRPQLFEELPDIPVMVGHYYINWAWKRVALLQVVDKYDRWGYVFNKKVRGKPALYAAICNLLDEVAAGYKPPLAPIAPGFASQPT